MSRNSNLLLSSLGPDIVAAITPHLEQVPLCFGDVLAETGDEVRRVYFPLTGVVSLVVRMQDGEMIETAMVGRDGVANAASALDGRLSLYRAIVQVPGEAVAISPDRLRSLARQFEPLLQILLRHEQVLLAQAQQSAACNASHSVEARMCRWMLRMRDLAESDDLMLTQQFLAQMLGVHRPRVSVVAGTLQRAGFISYQRGNIRLLDIDQLMDGSCECYATVSDHYARMLIAAS